MQVDYKEAENLRVTKEDFEFALQHDIKPAFGISEQQLDSYITNGTCRNESYCVVMSHIVS